MTPPRPFRKPPSPPPCADATLSVPLKQAQARPPHSSSPFLNRLLEGPRNVTRVLIVTPTRELAEQIHDVVKALSAGTKLRSATIYGGVGPAPQVKALRDGAEILIVCPGRFLDLVNQGHARLGKVEVACVG